MEKTKVSTNDIFIYKALNKILKEYGYSLAWCDDEIHLYNRDLYFTLENIPNPPIWSWTMFSDMLFAKRRQFTFYTEHKTKPLSIFNIFNINTMLGAKLNQLKSDSIEELLLKLNIMGYIQEDKYCENYNRIIFS